MIIGVGVDLVQIGRIRKAVTRHGERARRRFFTGDELTDCDSRAKPEECLAVRFAAKEAVLKALGTGKGPGIRWTDIEVTRDNSGPPRLRLGGLVLERANRLGVERTSLSLSHEGDYACAVVLLEGGSSA